MEVEVKNYIEIMVEYLKENLKIDGQVTDDGWFDINLILDKEIISTISIKGKVQSG